MSDHTPQFGLLRQRRFGPFFATQFLGAANDNLFKFALTVLVTYQLQVAWLPPSVAGLVIGALFILPFVLLSATAGQLADRMDKAVLMRRVKDCEIAIMAVALLGFVLQWPALLLLCLVGMGVHSTFFGPAKFAYLPQVPRLFSEPLADTILLWLPPDERAISSSASTESAKSIRTGLPFTTA